MMLEQARFEDFYRRYAPGVYRRARHVLGSDADAAEVVQNLFISLFESPTQFAGQSSWTTFLYQAATHACVNHLRDTRNRARLRAERSELLAPSGGLARGARAEELLLLKTLLAQMPDELACVAVYHHFDGLTQDETAQLMNCSRRHVVNLLTRLEEWASAQDADGTTRRGEATQS
jgi:RNA polymerase sigma factor (sigma-70 family)